ncbi:FKBP-type peptidyl-prolyl cis-trans isomerase SlpA [Azomonas agilis]|uniref:Peptidyl-prolyl cis-trans isomerase n=1 Tax=Azomonas agilis TaxID=116849 RepID=A0A562HZ55_9GAMM|nr:peptidylprolyl isomerase [Azomonas agilis]TWH64057.1 FKBP-type peptidyl-prolyl cis-trans isomerase SlpA [Azomonas agilis]
MTEQLIGPGKKVTLHFAIKMDSGQLVDSTFDKKPATFTVGDGSLLPGFEHSLFGLGTGAKQSITLAPEKAFGPHNPNNVQKLSRTQFEGMELSEGLMVMFSDAAKAQLPGVVKDFDAQQVTVDFNHPLAGQTLIFDVEVIEVI